MKNIALLLFAAITSSVLMTAASPGYDQWYAAYFALVPMLIAISLTGFGFLTGWLYGTLYFIINIHWVVNAVSDFGNSRSL